MRSFWCNHRWNASITHHSGDSHHEAFTYIWLIEQRTIAIHFTSGSQGLWGSRGETASIHSSSSKHLSHKHDPNLSRVVKDVLISPYSPYLLNAARHVPRGALQLSVECQALGSRLQEPVTPAKPSVTGDLQGTPGARWCTSIQATQSTAGKPLPHRERQGEIPPGHPDHPMNAAPTLHFSVPMTPGSTKSFLSCARSPQPLAFKMSAQNHITVTKKIHVAGQTHLLEPYKKWAMATHLP